MQSNYLFFERVGCRCGESKKKNQKEILHKIIAFGKDSNFLLIQFIPEKVCFAMEDKMSKKNLNLNFLGLIYKCPNITYRVSHET